MELDIRWKQRFQNFRRAFNLLRSALEDTNEYSDLELEGIIQRFEYTFELSWKTFKDYLEHSGIILEEVTPRKIIKECANKGIFAAAGMSADVYLNMMLERNALSHTYDLGCVDSNFIQCLPGDISATLRQDFACVPLARGAKLSLIGEKSPSESLEQNYCRHTPERFKQSLVNIKEKYLHELTLQYEFLSRKEIGDE